MEDNVAPFRPRGATAMTGLDLWVRRKWPFLLVGAIVLIGASYALFRYAISAPRDASSQILGTATSTNLVSTEGLVGRALDGVLIKPENAHLLPFAVMIESHPDARPLSGLSKANLVISAPVEGGIERYMAVFDASTTVDKIGPVRSARPYYIEWARSLNAVYGHVGGSPEAMNRLAGLLDFRNLDEIANGKYYWRDAKRSAPHNAYTSSELLATAARDKKWTKQDFISWVFSDTASGTSPGEIRDIRIPYGGSYNVRWVYDKNDDMYDRWLAGKRQLDADGTPVRAKNVLVAMTDGRVLDEEGRLYLRTAGEGMAWLFRNGYQDEVKWSREANEFISVKSPDGRPVAFGRGTTWIEFLNDIKLTPQVSSATSTGR